MRVKLGAILVGGRLFTSQAALTRFVRELNGVSAPKGRKPAGV
jgi:hypothetical protein